MRSVRAAAVIMGVLVLAACGGTGFRPPAATPGTGSGSAATSGTPGPSGAHPSRTGPRPSHQASPTAGTGPSSAPTSSPPVLGHSAWVAVSVATVWRSPSAPRAVDAPGLRAPADIRGWLADLTLSDRLRLVGRADTQVLLGDRVVVTAVQGSWAKVVVPDQPTPLDARGYPGWVPAAQLDAHAPEGRGSLATVVTRTAWLRSDTAARQPVAEVSYGTRLPLIASSGDVVRVSLPGGGVGRLDRSSVSVHPAGSPALAATGPSLVGSAQGFTGLPYLWAGRSGFGFDCSGLTSLVHRVHGITIPRDADAQASAGRAVAATSRGPGDLLFYATASGYVHHVSMDAGGGAMVQSPATGRAVETIPVTTAPYAAEYAGARRYLR